MEDYNNIVELFELHNSEVRRLRKILWKNRILDALKNKKLYYVKRLVFSLLVAVICFLSYALIEHPKNIIQTLKSLPKTAVADTAYIQDSLKSDKRFFDKLGFLESGNDYKIINQFGYMGKYQIGRSALTAIGMSGLSQEDFINNPQLQEIIVRLVVKKNKEILRFYIGKFQGKTIGGIYITESGILAAAQMAPGGVIDFLDSNGTNIFKDGNGSPITNYLKMFSGYRLNF